MSHLIFSVCLLLAPIKSAASADGVCGDSESCPNADVAEETHEKAEENDDKESELYKSLRQQVSAQIKTGGISCKDTNDKCKDWARSGECKNNPNFMLLGCPRSCYMCCEDTNDNCKMWADSGECEINPGYMLTGCPSACGTCELLDTSVRCKRTKDMVNGLKALPIRDMFERLDPGHKNFQFPQFKPEVMSRDPWVVYLHEFITPEEADGLIAALYESGHEFATSSELDLPEGEGATTKRRTSESMFCDNKECQEDPRVLLAHAKAQNMTGLELGNMEYIQIVRYDMDQYYVKHQDTSETYSRAANGNRIYTLFVYLTDVAEGNGGETTFPHIAGLKVRPKKGAAALWTNVMLDDPNKVDFRSSHEGSPLLGGPPKVGANFWMYAYDWRMLAGKGCMNVAVTT